VVARLEWSRLLRPMTADLVIKAASTVTSAETHVRGFPPLIAAALGKIITKTQPASTRAQSRGRLQSASILGCLGHNPMTGPASCGAFSSGSHRLDLLADRFDRCANF
jgi:hypothetical protein